MTATAEGNPGLAIGVAPIPGQRHAPPELIVDDEANDKTRVLLEATANSLYANPQVALNSLRKYASRIPNEQPDYPWDMLTDLGEPAATSFWFDADTNSAIQQDETYQHLTALRGNDHIRDMRILRLGIFLERRVAYQRRIGAKALRGVG